MKGKAETLRAIQETANMVLPSTAQLILFGSRARNDAREDSDWDLLIILDKEKRSVSDLEQYACPFMELGYENGIEINPIIYTKFEWNKRRYTLFHHNVEREGIEIWH